MSYEHVTVCDGKYTVMIGDGRDGGQLKALRHGEPWSRDIQGDKLIYWLAIELKKAREDLEAVLEKDPLARRPRPTVSNPQPKGPSAGTQLPLPVLQALRFYARGDHYYLDHEQDDSFDSVSGEPENWLCSEREGDATMFENGTIARRVLLGQPLNWIDGEDDEQPEPVEGEVFSAATEPAEVQAPAPVPDCAIRQAHDVLHKVRAMVPESDSAHAEIGAAMTALRVAAPVPPLSLAPCIAEIPTGYRAVLVPEGEAPPEPDWDEVKRQAEVVTGLKVEQHTFSIVIREVRRWITQRDDKYQSVPNRAPAVHDGKGE